MLVPEDTLFKNNAVLINIISCLGDVFSIEADSRWTIDYLKIKAVAYFMGADDSSKQSLYYKIVSVRQNQVLNESMSLSHEQIMQGDELLLIRKRMDIPEFEDPKKQGSKLKAPTAEEIQVATQGVPPKNVTVHVAEQPSSAFFQKELRKVLISLIDTAHSLHCMDPSLNQLFENAEKTEEEQKARETKKKLNYNETTLRQLKDMGFPEDLAITALHRNNNVPSEAIQWIVENEGADLEIGVEAVESSEIVSDISQSKSSKPQVVPSSEQAVAEETANQSEAGAIGSNDTTQECDGGGENKTSQAMLSSALNKMTGRAKVQRLLVCYKAFARSNFAASEQAVQQLREMGFEREDALDALRVNENKQDAACDWLLNKEHEKNKEDIGEGLDTKGELFKAITENPTVQLGLHNPLCIIAFLMMLESPTCTQRWLVDAEMGPMLATISNIYHAVRQRETVQAS